VGINRNLSATNAEIFQEKENTFKNDQGKGGSMKNIKPYSDYILKNFVDKTEIINEEALLPSEGRPVVGIGAHGPGFAWIPLSALIGKVFMDHGCGNVVGGIFPHKAMFLIPGLKHYYKKFLGTPTKVKTVNDIVKLLKNNDIGFTGTAPEGANCLLSFDQYVAPFRSKGLIAAAIKSDSDICLIAHQGAEDWSITLNLPFGVTVPFTNGLRGIHIPLLPYKKVDCYIVLCRRYKPILSSKEFESKPKKEARYLLNLEIKRIRNEMNLMTNEVKVLMKKHQINYKK
jgi:hypothetical protein